MRRILKSVLGCLLVVSVVLAAAFLYFLLRAPIFEKGNTYTLYYGNSSSAPFEETSFPARKKLFTNVKGESVCYSGDKLSELSEKFRAKLLFSETVCGIENYYFFSPLLGRPCDLFGYPVNLHIAVGGGKTAAGTPLIFGGF